MVIGASSKHFKAPLGSVIPLSLRAHRFKIMLQTICMSIIDFSCIFFICILGWVKKLFSWTKRTFFVGSFGISSHQHHGTWYWTAAGIGCGWLWPQSALLGAGGGPTGLRLGLRGFTLRTGDFLGRSMGFTNGELHRTQSVSVMCVSFF